MWRGRLRPLRGQRGRDRIEHEIVDCFITESLVLLNPLLCWMQGCYRDVVRRCRLAGSRQWQLSRPTWGRKIVPALKKVPKLKTVAFSSVCGVRPHAMLFDYSAVARGWPSH